LQPVTLGAKEGLALINGTQVSTALAIEGLFAAEHLLCAGVLTGALTLDAARGSDAPGSDALGYIEDTTDAACRCELRGADRDQQGAGSQQMIQAHSMCVEGSWWDEGNSERFFLGGGSAGAGFWYWPR
jgi:hypothetical protein